MMPNVDLIFLLGGSIFLFYWFAGYLLGGEVPSVDLPGHIAIIEALSSSLSSGKLFFYDPTGLQVGQHFSFTDLFFIYWVPF